MPTAIAEPEPHPRPFTVAEYYHMAEVVIIGPDERVELLDGQVIAVPPIGPRHGADVTSLTKLVDLVHDKVEVYRDAENGEFRETRILVRGETLIEQAFPDVMFTVDELLLSPA
jgi:Uma2 family endonuclease